MHTAALMAVADMLNRLPAPTRVLEIGSRNINGSVRGLFDGVVYEGIDVAEGPGVDVVADGATYVPTLPPDCVVCCEVLEHAPTAADIVRHMGAIVAPGGSVIVTCAGPGRAPHSAVDGLVVREGEHYANVSHVDMQAWFREAGIRPVYLHEGGGDLYACGVTA
jgi:hypothetical protein